MSLLRSNQTQRAYEMWRKEHAGENEPCFICDREPKTIWKNLWKIISNDFPYDAVTSKSDLLVPIRHFANKSEMTKEERIALDNLWEKMNDSSFLGYDTTLENFSHGRTEKGHYHLHLFVLKNHDTVSQ